MYDSTSHKALSTIAVGMRESGWECDLPLWKRGGPRLSASPANAKRAIFKEGTGWGGVKYPNIDESKAPPLVRQGRHEFAAVLLLPQPCGHGKSQG